MKAPMGFNVKSVEPIPGVSIGLTVDVAAHLPKVEMRPQPAMRGVSLTRGDRRIYIEDVGELSEEVLSNIKEKLDI